VNLERALRATDRLGGHIVQGHVDGVGRVLRAARDADALIIDLALPPGLSDLMVERGSIAVDGVSLTIVGLPETDVVQLSIIEVTRRLTTLGSLRAGDEAHIEADVIAKYVRRLLEAGRVTHEA
jgi:riboflavin synthase